MIEVFVGIGSNIQPMRHVPMALDALAVRFGDVRLSTAYRSPAVGFDGPAFINLVAGFHTDLGVRDLRRVLQEIEAECGRDRTAKGESRTMDVDLLLYGDAVTREPKLPRADILKYAFVLAPLAELVPEYRHPATGQRYRELWQHFDAASQPMTPVEICGFPT